MSQYIAIEHLSIYAQDTIIVEDLSLNLEQGETLTILGETGAGKSLLAQAIMGDLPPALKVTGNVLVNGVDMLRANRRECEQLWGRDIVMLPQEPWHSLSPMMKIRQQVAEVFRFTLGNGAREAQKSAKTQLDNLALKDDSDKVPSQLSGGMAQRVAFACASVTNAPLFLADEPTKGLDAGRKHHIIEQLKQKANDGTLLTITHDVSVAEALGGKCMVLKNGKLVETGDTRKILSSPSSNYTKTLIASAPQHWTATTKKTHRFAPLVSVNDLTIMRGNRTLFTGLSFSLGEGEIVGLCGDSGSGKTSLGDALLGLLPYQGNIAFHTLLHRYQTLKLYQDPPSSFADHTTLKSLIDDVIKLHKVSKKRADLLSSQLGLNQRLFERSASEVSGGELQRIALLRALLLKPKLLIADEPTSRLDPITSKAITHLLVDQCKEENCTVLFISHDRTQLEKVCDRVIDLQSLTTSKAVI